MVEARIDLPWWPPTGDEPIGEERARELVAALKLIVGPVVNAAEADLRQRINPPAEVVRHGAPASYFARVRCGPEVRSLCIGTVYEDHAGAAALNSIQLHRDGVLRWRRDR